MSPIPILRGSADAGTLITGMPEGDSQPIAKAYPAAMVRPLKDIVRPFLTCPTGCDGA